VDQKKRAVGAAERDEEHRTIWHRIVRQVAADRLVFVDESGANITLAPRYGRAPRGERCPGRVPRNYGQNTTLFASLSLGAGLSSAMLLDGPADRAAFEAYVERVLCPTLQPGQIVIMDNLAVHKQVRIRRLVRAAGCLLLFLPSYSPDFNPIEMAFAKIKASVRRRAARTHELLEQALAEAIDLVTLADARGFFRHCGYLGQ
jgi:transposase